MCSVRAWARPVAVAARRSRRPARSLQGKERVGAVQSKGVVVVRADSASVNEFGPLLVVGLTVYAIPRLGERRAAPRADDRSVPPDQARDDIREGRNS